MNLVSWRIIAVVWFLGNLFFNADSPLECEMLVCREETSSDQHSVVGKV